MVDSTTALLATMIIRILLACINMPSGTTAQASENVFILSSPVPSDVAINYEIQHHILNFSSDTEHPGQLCHSQTPSVLHVLWITVATWRNVARLRLCLDSVLAQQPPAAPHGMVVNILVNEDHSEDMLTEADRLTYHSNGNFIFTSTKNCSSEAPTPTPI